MTEEDAEEQITLSFTQNTTLVGLLILTVLFAIGNVWAAMFTTIFVIIGLIVFWVNDFYEDEI